MKHKCKIIISEEQNSFIQFYALFVFEINQKSKEPIKEEVCHFCRQLIFHLSQTDNYQI